MNKNFVEVNTMPVDIGSIIIITGAILLLPIMYGARYLFIENKTT